MDAFKQAFRENPIGLVGGSWLAVVAGTLFMVHRKQIPLQLKIIQARIVAQGALLTGCVRARGAAPLLQGVQWRASSPHPHLHPTPLWRRRALLPLSPPPAPPSPRLTRARASPAACRRPLHPLRPLLQLPSPLLLQPTRLWPRGCAAGCLFL